MKAFRWCAMTAFVLLCCAYTPIQHHCMYCGKPTHCNALLDYVASGFFEDYAHAQCSGWNDKKER